MTRFTDVVTPWRHDGWARAGSRPELAKLNIDTRQALAASDAGIGGLTLGGAPNNRIRTPKDEGKPAVSPKRNEPDKQENRPPLFQKDFPPAGGNMHYFGGDIPNKPSHYFGGVIFRRSDLRVTPTLLTRSDGRTHDPNHQLSLPPTSDRLKEVVRATGSLRSDSAWQSGVWVAPNLFLSCLHMWRWVGEAPSPYECEALKTRGHLFYVDNENNSTFNSSGSIKVALVHYDCAYHLGIFKATVETVSHWIDAASLVDHQDLSREDAGPGTPVACIGYNAPVDANQQEEIIAVARAQMLKLHGSVPLQAFPIDPVDWIKPAWRTFALGTIDEAGINPSTNVACFGGSATLWKGTSGGPCIIADGPRSGQIIGFNYGYAEIEDAFNLVNAFPVGLKDVIEELSKPPPLAPSLPSAP